MKLIDRPWAVKIVTAKTRRCSGEECAGLEQARALA
jgi:hypothetical protein